MIEEILKYIDLFGTKFTFYSDNCRKYYTPLGGFLSLITIIISIIILFAINFLDKIKNISTLIYFETPIKDNKNNNLGEKKIWIPWRIIDSNNNNINFTDIINPEIYYYSKKRNNINESFNINNKKIINYVLCNETLLKNISNNYININIDKFFCIEIDNNIEMGGSLFSLYYNYIQFTIYKYDIINYIDYNDKIIELFYPIIKYQNKDKKFPIIFEYERLYYNINKYTYKIDDLLIQENILTEERGYLSNEIKNKSFWGYKSLYSNYYYNLSGNKLYRLNIYFDLNIKYYKKTYKKIHIIFIEKFPLFYIFFLIMENIAKIIKLTEERKKIYESLFDNIIEKENKFQIYKNNNSIRKSRESKILKSSQNILLDKNLMSLKNINNESRKYKGISSNYLKSPLFKPKEIFYSKNNTPSFLLHNKIYNIPKITDDINFLTPSNKKSCVFERQVIRRERYELFPFYYYLFSIFYKNLTKINFEKCFSISNQYDKFLNINRYIGKFLDISSYIFLYKEFQVLKEMTTNKINSNLVNQYRKININDKIAMRNLIRYVNLNDTDNY